MHIRRLLPSDADDLLDIWMRSVAESHSFITAEDRVAMVPQVREYFSSGKTEFWVLCDEIGTSVGFMGLAGNDLESLFLVPGSQRRGGGRALVRHAQSLHRELITEVNEQNVAALRFYEACGFGVVGRTDFDRQGRPYPLLNMRWANSIPDEPHVANQAQDRSTPF